MVQDARTESPLAHIAEPLQYMAVPTASLTLCDDEVSRCTDERVAVMVAHMRRCGQLSLIAVDEHTNVLAGTSRVLAARQLGWEFIAVSVDEPEGDVVQTPEQREDWDYQWARFLDSQAGGPYDPSSPFPRETDLTNCYSSLPPKKARAVIAMIKAVEGSKKGDPVEIDARLRSTRPRRALDVVALSNLIGKLDHEAAPLCDLTVEDVERLMVLFECQNRSWIDHHASLAEGAKEKREQFYAKEWNEDEWKRLDEAWASVNSVQVDLLTPEELDNHHEALDMVRDWDYRITKEWSRRLKWFEQRLAVSHAVKTYPTLSGLSFESVTRLGQLLADADGQ